MKDQQNINIYNTSDGVVHVALFAKNGQVWMSQAELAILFDITKQNISQHISYVLNDKELNAESVVKNYLTTATDGKSYEVSFYALDTKS